MSPQWALFSACCKLAPAGTTVLPPGAGVAAMAEFTDTRGNSAGPSIDADAGAPRLNMKAVVTPINATECRINATLESTEPWALTTTPW